MLPLQDFYKVIRARALADTGSGGLFNSTSPLITGWYTRLAAQPSTLPYVVVNLIDAGNFDGFATSCRRIIIRVSLFTAGNSEASIETIRARILGNWITASGRNPTYGLERWTPTMSNSYGCSAFRFINQTELFEERVTQTIFEFEAYVSKTNATP